MAKKTEQTAEPANGFDEEARAALAADIAFDPAAERMKELEEAAQKTTPKGRKTKDAREATKALEMKNVLEPSLSAVNLMIGAKFPELLHSAEEIETMAVLGGAVLAKHVDSALTQYGDEIVLATFLAGSFTEKGFRLYARLNAEAKERKRTADPNAKAPAEAPAK